MGGGVKKNLFIVLDINKFTMLEKSRSYQEFAVLASDARLFCPQHRPKKISEHERKIIKYMIIMFT